MKYLLSWIICYREWLFERLTENDFLGKVVELWTNSNFGGTETKGGNNVLTEVEKKTFEHGLIEAERVGHIWHVTAPAAADMLPVYVEMIASKINLYFKSYTVKAETKVL